MFKKIFLKATQLQYQENFAKTYRIGDETDVHHPEVRYLANLLSSHTQKGNYRKVLDIGCGAGRYFHAVKNTDEIVGIDPSRAMLHEAKHPALGEQVQVARITLINCGFLEYHPKVLFDFAYSFGVLGEHIPFDYMAARHTYELLKHDGYFLFTVINPFASFSYLLKQILKKLFRALHIAQSYQFMNTSAFGFNTKSSVRKFLEQSGFKIILIEDVQKSHPHYLILAQKI